MSSFCIAKATHIFFSKEFQHICVSVDENFNESLTNDVVSFEQLALIVSVSEFCYLLDKKKMNVMLLFTGIYTLDYKNRDNLFLYDHILKCD